MINLPLVTACLWLVLKAVPATKPQGRRRRVDVIGAMLCVLGLGGSVFALIEQPRLGWSSPAVSGSLAAGVLLFVAFLVYESRASDPMPLAVQQARAGEIDSDTGTPEPLDRLSVQTLSFFATTEEGAMKWLASPVEGLMLKRAQRSHERAAKWWRRVASVPRALQDGLCSALDRGRRKPLVAGSDPGMGV